MNRLAFVLENGAKLSTDVFPPNERISHDARLQAGIDELALTMSRIWPEHSVQQVIFYRYTLENRKAFVEHHLELDYAALNARIKALSETPDLIEESHGQHQHPHHP
jgi:hypothetical protein